MVKSLLVFTVENAMATRGRGGERKKREEKGVGRGTRQLACCQGGKLQEKTRGSPDRAA